MLNERLAARMISLLWGMHKLGMKQKLCYSEFHFGRQFFLLLLQVCPLATKYLVSILWKMAPRHFLGACVNCIARHLNMEDEIHFIFFIFAILTSPFLCCCRPDARVVEGWGYLPISDALGGPMSAALSCIFS